MNKFQKSLDRIKKNVPLHEDSWIDEDKEHVITIMEALEKQILKKPTPHIVDGEKIKIGNGYWCKGTTIYYCPNCKDFISRTYKFCHKCGQALDWSDNE